MALTKIQAAGLTADLIDETKLADNSIDSEHYNDGSIDNAHLADDAVGIAELSATGTASSSTFLRGDNSWQAISTTPEGTSILSTGETGTAKFLRIDGDNSCSWQVPPDTNTQVGGATGVGFNDNVYIQIGTGNDLKLFHNGTNSKIENATGALYIDGATNGSIYLRPDNGQSGIDVIQEGAVKLYHDNVLRAQTTAHGFQAFGNLTIRDDVIFYIGDGNDLQIKHDATNSYISNSTGQLYIESGSGCIDLIKGTYASGEWMLRAIADGAVEAYHNGNKKLWTRSDGIEVTGKGVFSNHIYLPDDVKLILGNDPDLEIYHTGSHGYIKNDTGKLFLQAKDGEHSIECEPDEGVKLYYNNVKKLESTNDGITVSGRVQVDGNCFPYSDNASDLGLSSNRWQDLYLSGNLYLGGTGSSNAMDDYEEGTWTPDLSAMTSLSFNSRGGRYTKIGRFVWVAAYMNISQRTGTGGHMKLTGLPFTCADEIARGGGRVVYASGLTSDTYDVPTLLIENNQTQAGFYKGDGSTFSSESMHMSQGSIYITFTYEVA